ncbi:MAG: hypothetical protein FH753_03460 [Firmicutes bacterium]|nr:hypothetical protein [Bacillota bacterium]
MSDLSKGSSSVKIDSYNKKKIENKKMNLSRNFRPVNTSILPFFIKKINPSKINYRKNKYNKKVGNKKKEIEKMKIACILDYMPYEWLRYECNLITISPDNWKEKIDIEKPDLLLVQSAWHGIENKWLHKLVNIHQKKECVISEIIGCCNERNIPTILCAQYGHSL